MVHTEKLRKPKRRGERHSAAWGKRLGMTLLLATGRALGQNWSNQAGNHGRIADELSEYLAKAHRGTAQSQTVKVIVQYRRGPPAAQFQKLHGRGGRLPAEVL